MKKIYAQFILIFTDMICLYLAMSIAYFFRDELAFLFSESLFEDISFYNELLIYYIVTFMFFWFFQIYTKHYDFWSELRCIYKSLSFSFIIVFALLALTKQAEDFSRFIIIIAFLLLIFFLPIVKFALKFILVKIKLWQKEIQFYDNTDKYQILEKELMQNWYMGIKRVKKSKTILIVCELYSYDELNKISENLLITYKEILFIPTLSNINLTHASIIDIYNSRISILGVKNRLKSTSAILVKNIFDFFMIILSLPLMLIIFAVVSILIYFDSGFPIIFAQKRLGKNKNVFICFKFRTMYQNSQEILASYLEKNPEEIINYNNFHKYKKDPRVTKIGRFLRKTSLDELPQILNVIKAEMSLIGPRPYMIEERNKIKNNINDILLVKPGITGLWQVSGRNELEFSKRVELDRWYIQNWSLWLDFIIFIKTIKIVLGRKGAN